MTLKIISFYKALSIPHSGLLETIFFSDSTSSTGLLQSELQPAALAFPAHLQTVYSLLSSIPNVLFAGSVSTIFSNDLLL